MIPICLILFILFIAVITFAIKRADSAQAKVTEEPWEKERTLNSTLRGDRMTYEDITSDKRQLQVGSPALPNRESARAVAESPDLVIPITGSTG